MRAFAIAVVGSVVVHAGAIAWVAYADARGADLHDDDGRDVAIGKLPAPDSPPDMPAPDRTLEITFFEYTSNTAAGSPVESPTATDAAPAKRGVARFGSGGHSAARVRGDEVAGDGGDPGGADDGKARSPLMTMRGPEKPGLQGISSKFFEEFMKNTKPLAPPDDIPGERIGNEIAELRAQLKRAGRYSPEELAGLRERIVALNAEREAEELKPAGGGTFKSEKRTFRAKVGADGSVKLEDKPEELDAQDRLMLRHGIDPYAKVKLDYLDRTREQRVAVGKRWRKEQLKKSVVYVQQHVARLLASTVDPAVLKEGLFELWDECIESGSADEVEGGAAARAFIMGVIRTKVTYTADELRALNARRQSKQAFAP